METYTELLVTDEDIDEMGHVNNSVFVTYLEKGREHWYRLAGFSFTAMKQRGIGTVVARLDIAYKKELNLGEVVRIKTSPIKSGHTSLIFEQQILNSEGEVSAEATVVSVMVSRKNHKPIPVIKDIAQHFKTPT